MKMKIKLFMTLLLQCIYFSIINAQVTQEWVARYNSSGSRIDIPSSMAIDGSGNVYITGTTKTESYSYDDDFLTIKYNSSGIEQWVRTYNGPLDNVDKANAIAVDNLGYIYVTGSSTGNQYGYFNWVTIKYNSAGQEQWLQRYAPLGGGEPASIVVDESGFVYVSGHAEEGYGMHFTTIKYNSAGVPLWETSELPYEGKNIAAMKVDNAGNVYVTGLGYLGDPVYSNYVTIKYNSDGIKQWATFYNGPDLCNEPKSIALDDLGNVYVTGSSEGSYNNNDFLTVKYNPSGIQEWEARYEGPAGAWDDAYSIAVDNSGNVFVTGRSGGMGTGYDYATIKYNSSGVQQWVQRYNGNTANPGDDVPYEIVPDEKGNVYITGYSRNGGGYATIKYNSSGVQQWLQAYNGPAFSDAAISVKTDASGNVYVTGYSAGSGTHFDFATIKYSQSSSGVPEQNSEKSLFRLFPNPASHIVTIDITTTNREDPEITIYNMMGISVRSEMLKQNHQQINIGDLRNGSYTVEIKSKEWTEKQKLLIQR
ncbi:MAG: T9SS C-terminal target domain-containing protein [Bacteroidetes bacterium]|nr:MAG: T9SS C-terminal target domain-containing protein [Bacteroidota bacterium]